MMSSLPVNDAQNNLQEIIDQVAEQGKPVDISRNEICVIQNPCKNVALLRLYILFRRCLVIIRGDRGNAILLAEKDWSAIQETLYLLSVPGMRESIKEGLATSIQECYGELDW